MRNLKTKLIAVATAALVCASAALAQDSGPLIDILVRKGLLSDQEAEDLRAELVRDFASNTAAGKLNLSSTVTELRISGDARIRYEGRGGELANGDDLHRDRFRYRFRTLLSGKVLNNWAFGARLETSTGSRSSNVTMGDDAGPFAKTNDGIYIGQIYATWTPTAEWSFTAGRMANPLVTTSMVWDGDINPEGLAEQFRTRRGNNEFFVTLGQFLYSTSGTQDPFAAVTPANIAGTEDLFFTAWQGGYKRYINGATNFFQISPVLYTFLGADQRANPAAFNTVATATNAAPINNLTVLEIPFEYNWVAGNGVPLRAFADFAINLDADKRAAKFGRPDLDGEDKAYHVGFQYGKASLPREWDARVIYQSVGAFALDSNLVDSDLFDSKTNMQGFILGGNYALGAATQLSLTYANGERKNDSVIASGSGDVGANNALDKYWIWQVDLNVKF
ncbi:putative porin [Oleiharenicola lentus]|uniref:putative porin n=1 Tax=Oleiharenicola lentus TaxID=2508720 RepID=UPI003F669A25